MSLANDVINQTTKRFKITTINLDAGKNILSEFYIILIL
ncbi:MAG: hypothetical protein ACD_7C00095G0002 [uncultured bacterium]|nr:MAG: hypothetical protein ACD_7C00095G0002 [uncultured bacterium]KKP68864.1 MAG: hypothetical protein UR66_C0003G0129 [Candidatus Moranbacteria bacterium GW2011_GWE1_35_17]KKP84595.1 MAG: hypothetical protein UR82_C0002G0012 [Candidatus Moranbacteria bacterium GW2011_GWF1_35_5]